MKKLSQVSITNLTCDEQLDENGAITLNFFDSQVLLRSRFIFSHCRECIGPRPYSAVHQIMARPSYYS